MKKLGSDFGTVAMGHHQVVRRWLDALRPAPPRCTCGYLDWTTATFGRVSHKHRCPARRDPWCQAHPEGCP